MGVVGGWEARAKGVIMRVKGRVKRSAMKVEVGNVDEPTARWGQGPEAS